MLMCQLRQCVDVGNVAVGVAQSFDIDGPGVILNGIFNFVQIVNIDKDGSDAEIGKGVLQQVIAAAVDGLLGNEVAPILSQCLQGICAPEDTASAATPPSKVAIRFSNTSCVELVSRP